MRGRGRQHALHEEAAGVSRCVIRSAAPFPSAALALRRIDDQAPHIAERDQAEEVHIIGGTGAGILGLAIAFCTNHMVACCNSPSAWPSGVT